MSGKLNLLIGRTVSGVPVTRVVQRPSLKGKAGGYYGLCEGIEVEWDSDGAVLDPYFPAYRLDVSSLVFAPVDYEEG